MQDPSVPRKLGHRRKGDLAETDSTSPQCPRLSKTLKIAICNKIFSGPDKFVT
jgi:hypothetical protein